MLLVRFARVWASSGSTATSSIDVGSRAVRPMSMQNSQLCGRTECLKMMISLNCNCSQN